VIRPKFPLDILQGSVGEAEDVLVSLFESVHNAICDRTEQSKVFVILDDIEHVLGTYSADAYVTPLLRRCRSTFIALLDSLYQQLDNNRDKSEKRNRVLILLTTSYPEIATQMPFNFDHVCYLELPNDNERRDLIDEILFVRKSDRQAMETIMNDLVVATTGKSYAEIIQLCRQSIEIVAMDGVVKFDTTTELQANRHQDDHATRSALYLEMELLQAMKERLQSNLPESLRNEFLDGYVDMRVFSSRDLLASKQRENASVAYATENHLPSPSADIAWKALQSSIIIPLCKSKELQQLVDTSRLLSAKTIAGAVLITGESGSGKTALAIRCATYVSELLPTVKLIDVTCTSLIHKEVGASEQAIKHLFDAARRAAPAILLLESIETIAAVRGNDATTEGTMDRILSALLIELDGIDDNVSKATNHGIAVIGITHDETLIDPALKRPGRLDRAIHLRRDWI
jgi:SpoVK/Ycf46/Vps4 family AAA+-type ATPase